jgi:molybdenum cofactor guanylyltransferase
LLGALAGDGPAYVADLPVLRWWPATLADQLADWLAGDQPRAVRRWAEAVGARAVALPSMPANVNTREDLAALHE